MQRALTHRIMGSVVLAMALAMVALTPFGQRFERDTGLASLYALRGQLEVPEGAIVVGLDRNSMEWLELHAPNLGAASERLGGCMSPDAAARLEGVRDVSGLPRALHGCLIRELTARGARVIAFDILFRVPLPEEDDGFAEDIAAAGSVVLFERIRTDAGQVGAADTLLMRQGPREVFAKAAQLTAFFLLNAPSGNIVEGYFRALSEFPDLPSMPAAAMSVYTDFEIPAQAEEPGIQLIWLYGPAETVPTYTLREVFDDRSARRLPRDLSSVAVFVGVSDPDQPGTKDHYKIPIGGDARDVGGVELAATAFLNRLHGQNLAAPGREANAALVFAAVLAMMLAARALPGRWGLVSVLPVAGAYAAAAWVAFAVGHLWMPFAVPVYLGATAAALVALATRYAFARTLVTRLAPKQVAAMLLESPGPDRQAAQAEQATVMFTDLVGSTKLGDRLSNLEYTAILNHYYDTATEAIEVHDGMVVEFMGDGIVALFSESVTGPDHARLACEAALALCDRLRAAPPLDPGAEAEPLRLRVGINTGVTATGEIGARHRFNFKALGDTVNIAARLEQYGREIDDGDGDVILLSHVTCAMSGLPNTRFENLGSVSLRGKSFPTGVARLRPERN